MSIRNLVDELETTMGLEDEDDFLQQMSLEFETLCNGEKALEQLPTLEAELEKQKSLLAKANQEKQDLNKKVTDYESKYAEQMLKIQQLEKDTMAARLALDAEKKATEAAQQKISALQKVASSPPAKTAIKIVPKETVSKTQLMGLQEKATESLKKCRSLQSVLNRHATVYGKQNDQFKKLSALYKKEKEELAQHVSIVKKATDSLQSSTPRYKIESVF